MYEGRDYAISICYPKTNQIKVDNQWKQRGNIMETQLQWRWSGCKAKGGAAKCYSRTISPSMDGVEGKESAIYIINITHSKTKKPTVDNHKKQRKDFSQRYTIAVEADVCCRLL